MWDDFISGQIRRTNRNLFLLGTGVLTILGLLLAAGWRDAYNFVFGAFPVQGSELVSIWNRDIPKRYFLKVQGEKSFATGMQEVDASNRSYWSPCNGGCPGSSSVSAKNWKRCGWGRNRNSFSSSSSAGRAWREQPVSVRAPDRGLCSRHFAGESMRFVPQADAKSSYPHASCSGPLTPDDQLGEFLRLGCSA